MWFMKKDIPVQPLDDIILSARVQLYDTATSSWMHGAGWSTEKFSWESMVHGKHDHRLQNYLCLVPTESNSPDTLIWLIAVTEAAANATCCVPSLGAARGTGADSVSTKTETANPTLPAVPLPMLPSWQYYKLINDTKFLLELTFALLHPYVQRSSGSTFISAKICSLDYTLAPVHRTNDIVKPRVLVLDDRVGEWQYNGRSIKRSNLLNPNARRVSGRELRQLSFLLLGQRSLAVDPTAYGLDDC
ncbi:uncharacterized protein F5147DRAFT_648026 [Suillus discolor]|uniref:Uncharacterized protein n=1 Tax=Suillus discolor TaxID=1912936 RepID=A0A9P7FK93_9AGAM|nr:uncharacterized protein F5147DRAFT_648026 [Suillus discolor]KAG2118920.1 hypothetical protein F5147DRAFT_648026 [Suillus discolor]